MVISIWLFKMSIFVCAEPRVMSAGSLSVLVVPLMVYHIWSSTLLFEPAAPLGAPFYIYILFELHISPALFSASTWWLKRQKGKDDRNFILVLFYLATAKFQYLFIREVEKSGRGTCRYFCPCWLGRGGGGGNVSYVMRVAVTRNPMLCNHGCPSKPNKYAGRVFHKESFSYLRGLELHKIVTNNDNFLIL